MKIKEILKSDQDMGPLPDESNLGFGIHFTDHMFTMEYRDNHWVSPVISPYGKVYLDPASVALHYGQAIFEGLKAYRGKDDKIRLFRPSDNMERLNKSAWRMCMPEIDKDFVLHAVKRLVKVDNRWVPSAPGTSLYVRPFMVATEAFLGVRPATEYLFMVIMCPVGAYYPEGFNPVKIFVTDKYVRAAIGGVGEAKTAGNYAASLMASEEARDKGFTQVLWLDARHRSNIEEVGTMNMFFVMDDTLVTPALSGSILPGITRDSIIELARSWNMPVEERTITIDEVIDGIASGRLKECFGSGTAAVVSPVGSLYYKEKDYVVNNGETGEFARKFFDEITGIQYGEKPDNYGWIEFVE